MALFGAFPKSTYPSTLETEEKPEGLDLLGTFTVTVSTLLTPVSKSLQLCALDNCYSSIDKRTNWLYKQFACVFPGHAGGGTVPLSLKLTLLLCDTAVQAQRLCRVWVYSPTAGLGLIYSTIRTLVRAWKLGSSSGGWIRECSGLDHCGPMCVKKLDLPDSEQFRFWQISH